MFSYFFFFVLGLAESVIEIYIDETFTSSDGSGEASGEGSG